MNRTAIVIALACVARAAAAQPSAQDQAKQHFKQARLLQDEGKFDAAIGEYQAAYDLDHRAEMLFNIAQAHRLANHKQQAIDFYQRYLAAQPDGAGAREARQWTAELTRQIEAERPLTTEPTRPVDPPARPVPPTELPRKQDATMVPRPRQASPQLQIAGIATAGVGVLALGAGVFFGVKARDASDTISKHTGPWTDTEQSTFEDGQRANRNMIIAYVGGGALVATGAVLYYLGTRTHVAPMAGTQTAGLTVWGHF
jgi:tetratricopeptide (TPR) repeat protein